MQPDPARGRSSGRRERGDQCGCVDHPDAWDRRQSACRHIFPSHARELAVEGGDPRIGLAPLDPQILDEQVHARRQTVIFFVGEDRQLIV